VNGETTEVVHHIRGLLEQTQSALHEEVQAWISSIFASGDLRLIVAFCIGGVVVLVVLVYAMTKVYKV